MSEITKASDLIVPEVMADMISAKVEKKIVVTPFAKVDTTLVGVAGDEVTIPTYAYIGDAEDVAEGVECGTVKLTATTKKIKVKKAMKAVNLTDEAVLNSKGNPVGETNNQLALAIASKVDNDAMDALQTAQLAYVDGNVISYDGIVDAIDLFEEEKNCEKAMFVHPKQMTHLRHDVNFISADKYTGKTVFTGEVGRIANTRVVTSRKVPLNTEEYVLTKSEPSDWSSKYKTYFTKSEETYSAVTGNSAPTWEADKYYEKLAAGTKYICPIIKLTQDNETEDETPALTVFLKRNTNVETERHTLARSTDISADRIYAVGLTNSSKVVLAKFNATK